MTLRYQTFRQRFQFTSSSMSSARELKAARKEMVDNARRIIIEQVDAYLQYGLMDDRKRELGHPLPGPFTEFDIIEIEDWGFFSDLDTEGEEVVRIWYTTNP